MTIIKLKSELERLFREHPVRWMKCIINPKNTEWHWLETELNAAFPLLSDPAYTLHTKIYWVLTGMTDFPKCEVCGNPVIGTNVKSCFTGYKHLFCSKECRYKTAHQHAVETNVKKYGVANPMQAEEISSKSRETLMSATAERKQEIKNKRAATCMKRYGVENAGWTKESQEKIKKHFLKKIGSESWTGSEEFKNKTRNTCREKYGADSWFGSDEFQKKLPKIIKEKYGVENAFSIPEVQIRQKTVRLKKMYESLMKNSSIVKPIFSEENLLDAALKNGALSKLHGKKFLWECQKCGAEFESEINWNDFHHRGMAAWCPVCFPPLPNRSICEKELAIFIETIVPASEVRVNVKDVIPPFELDIYIPSKNLAFEFDGLFYHSEGLFHSMEKTYHLNKTELCEKLGIHLVHVFENEWMTAREIVKSKLKIMLGGNDVVKMGARQCVIDENISTDEIVEFLNENHLQGSAGYRRGDVAIGLRLKTHELVSLMTFSKPRFDKKHEWELVRFCSKLNCHVSGAASRILSHFEHAYHPKSIVSYADRRWTMNNENTVYDKLGFKLDHISPPNYGYWKSGSGYSIESRIKYQKHKLLKLLEKFDPAKSEIQNMLNNGFRLIYDCGNLVYTKKFE